MSGLEVAGLVLGGVGLVGLVTVLKEAYTQVQAHRQRRRIRIFGFGPPSTTRLANEIQTGESTLVSRYHEFHNVYGDKFAQGDEIAIGRLKDLIIQLQHGLILALQSAQQAGKISSPSSLVTVAITGRTDTLTTLSELAQRLATELPIRRFPSLYDIPKSSSTQLTPQGNFPRPSLRPRTRSSLYDIPKSSSTELVPRVTFPRPSRPSRTRTRTRSPNFQAGPEVPETTVASIIESLNSTRPQSASQGHSGQTARRERSRNSGTEYCDCGRKFVNKLALKQHREALWRSHT